jgi:hypothetical protein
MAVLMEIFAMTICLSTPFLVPATKEVPQDNSDETVSDEAVSSSITQEKK